MFGFCTADFLSYLSFLNINQLYKKPKHCLTPGFLIPLVTFVDFFDEGGMKCLRLSFDSRVPRTCFVDCFEEGGTIFRPRWSNITDLKLEC